MASADLNCRPDGAASARRPARHPCRAVGCVAAFMIAAIGSVAGTSAAPLQPDSIIDVRGNSHPGSRWVREYAPDWTVRQEWPVEDPAEFSDLYDGAVRRVDISPEGTILMVLGTFHDVFLAELDPVTGAWSHATHPEWTLINNVTFGGLVAHGDFVYVADQPLVTESTRGILRHDRSTGEWTRVVDWLTPIDLTLGRDGYLYALESDYHIVKLDLDTLAYVSDVWTPLPFSSRYIAVDANGHVFGNDLGGYVRHFSPDGSFVRQLVSSNRTGHAGIELAADGRLLARGSYNYIDLGDRSFSGWNTFTHGYAPETRSTFADPPSVAACAYLPPPSVVTDLRVTRSGRDLTFRWQPTADASGGYGVHAIENASLVRHASRAGVKVAATPPDPSLDSVILIDAVTNVAGLIYYNLVAACFDGETEGPQ